MAAQQPRDGLDAGACTQKLVNSPTEVRVATPDYGSTFASVRWEQSPLGSPVHDAGSSASSSFRVLETAQGEEGQLQAQQGERRSAGQAIEFTRSTHSWLFKTTPYANKYVFEGRFDVVKQERTLENGLFTPNMAAPP